MDVLILLCCIVMLVLLIAWAKVNTFLAFLIVSVTAALLLGMPATHIPQTVNKGLGDTLGSLSVIIVLGAMLGKLVAFSGAAQKIATVLKNTFGYRYITWAMSLTGFIVGIPLFYNVGFVLLIPIIFSVAYNYKLPLVYVGLPMLASLSVMHGFLPPHPSPMALVSQFHADLVKTFIYGLIVAVPAIIIAGPVFSKALIKMQSKPTVTLKADDLPDHELPGITNSIISALLPVLIILGTTLMARLGSDHIAMVNVARFIGDPTIAMILTICIATYTLGMRLGKKLTDIMNIYVEAAKDIAMILFIILPC